MDETPKAGSLQVKVYGATDGKNADGSVSNLSKRHGAVSFQDLLDDGLRLLAGDYKEYRFTTKRVIYTVNKKDFII